MGTYELEAVAAAVRGRARARLARRKVRTNMERPWNRLWFLWPPLPVARVIIVTALVCQLPVWPRRLLNDDMDGKRSQTPLLLADRRVCVDCCAASPLAAAAGAVAPAALREDQVKAACTFLQHPKVSKSSASKRVAFLESKGLTVHEITEALRRVIPNAEETRLVAAAAARGEKASAAVAHLTIDEPGASGAAADSAGATVAAATKPPAATATATPTASPPGGAVALPPGVSPYPYAAYPPPPYMYGYPPAYPPYAALPPPPQPAAASAARKWTDWLLPIGAAVSAGAGLLYLGQRFVNGRNGTTATSGSATGAAAAPSPGAAPAPGTATAAAPTAALGPNAAAAAAIVAAGEAAAASSAVVPSAAGSSGTSASAALSHHLSESRDKDFITRSLGDLRGDLTDMAELQRTTSSEIRGYLSGVNQLVTSLAKQQQHLAEPQLALQNQVAAQKQVAEELRNELAAIKALLQQQSLSRSAASAAPSSSAAGAAAAAGTPTATAAPGSSSGAAVTANGDSAAGAPHSPSRFSSPPPSNSSASGVQIPPRSAPPAIAGGGLNGTGVDPVASPAPATAASTNGPAGSPIPSTASDSKTAAAAFSPPPSDDDAAAAAAIAAALAAAKQNLDTALTAMQLTAASAGAQAGKELTELGAVMTRMQMLITACLDDSKEQAHRRLVASNPSYARIRANKDAERFMAAAGFDLTAQAIEWTKDGAAAAAAATDGAAPQPLPQRRTQRSAILAEAQRMLTAAIVADAARSGGAGANGNGLMRKPSSSFTAPPMGRAPSSSSASTGSYAAARINGAANGMNGTNGTGAFLNTFPATNGLSAPAPLKPFPPPTTSALNPVIDTPASD